MMPHPIESPWVRALCRIYSVLLYAYPAEFRARFGAEMRQVFADGCRDAVRTSGLFRFLLRSAKDWLASAAAERRAWRPAWPRGWQWLRHLAAGGAVAILVFLFVTTNLVRAYVIPTSSMEGSLRIGDHVLMNRLARSYRPVQRGDIVAFLYPEDVHQTFVKRVIGVAGDRLRLVDKQVIRNGRRLVEPYALHNGSHDAYRDNFPSEPASFTTGRARDMFANHVTDGEVIVPPQALFVLGDNRDNSLDSRYWGFVPEEYVVGSPLMVYWSYDAPTADLATWNLRHFADLAQHFFTKTRWQRTLFVPLSEQAQEVEP